MIELTIFFLRNELHDAIMSDLDSLYYDAKRFLSKNNYLIQTYAVKNYFIPALKDIGVAKNYLKEDELRILNNSRTGYKNGWRYFA